MARDNYYLQDHRLEVARNAQLVVVAFLQHVARDAYYPQGHGLELARNAQLVVVAFLQHLAKDTCCLQVGSCHRMAL